MPPTKQMIWHLMKLNGLLWNDEYPTFLALVRNPVNGKG